MVRFDEPGRLERKPHVLIVSIAFPGHFGPFVQIIYKLAQRYTGITVTVMGNKDRIDDLRGLQRKGDFTSLDLHLEEVFGPIPVYTRDPKFPVRSALTAERNFLECEVFRKKLVEEKDENLRPTVVIADMFQYWSKDLADELGVPWYPYWSTCPLYSVCAMMSSQLIKDGLLLPPNQPNRNSLLTDVPGLNFIRVGDLAGELYEFQEFYQKVVSQTRRSAGMILNSSEDMDGGAVKALAEIEPSLRVLLLGPSLQFPGYGVSYSSPISNRDCLKWLDTWPKSTVLYVAFGSLGSITEENVLELAAGLEASGVPFLWALKPGSRKVSDLLPVGFEERVKGRGLIETGWAPQSQILAHPSTGGFLSHCGWNSTMESIVAGVPIISWPLSADQLITTRFVADMAKLGFNIADAKSHNQDNFEDIGREEVEKNVRKLLYEEEGRKVRRNVESMAKSVAAAVAEGGSTHRNLLCFFDEITSVRKT